MDLVPYGLATRVLGRTIHVFDEVASTNDIAANFAQAGAEEGTLVVARRQTQGRGRHARRWESPEGGLWMSIVLRPELRSDELPGLTLVVATSVAQSLQHLTGLSARTRWPNDVYVGERKIAGLLAEARWTGDRPDFCCVGLGLNVNVELSLLPADVAARATSVQALLGREVTVEPLLVAVLNRMEEMVFALGEGGFSSLRGEVSEWCDTLGHTVCVARDRDSELTGRAMEIGPQGSLLVHGESGITDIWTCESVRMLD